ncbi:hypothetical protein E1B28_008651 [Marasmius oreades]|uniref:Uncharacterized protein n=1 Tax=Marasmius oreades TaxID=181124 RepID=A0A9P7RYS0_9AGAR|nr:uncharacterized protein E1B28_008651 [Marasmius oreades]KAG7092289.1 hypothetical protein E1B28_008651 [Marasmius oreades]
MISLQLTFLPIVLSTFFLHPIHGLTVSEIQARNRNSSLADRGLQKRFGDARFTFYDPGLGACGGTNSNSDFIVALNAPQWDGGSHCFQTITITFEGKTHDAQVVDLCPGCPYGGLDMSRSLFDVFAPQDRGVISGSWEFGSGGGESEGGEQQTSTSAPPPPPETATEKSTAPPPPTAAATTSATFITSATTRSIFSVTTSTVSETTSTASTSASATSTGVGFPHPGGVFVQLGSGIGDFAAIVVAAATEGLN